MRAKPRKDLVRVRATMLAIGHAIERKHALLQMLLLQGHNDRARRLDLWIEFYVERFEQLKAECRRLADAETARYWDKLKTQVGYLPADSLDQESARHPEPESAGLGEFLESMNTIEINAPKLTFNDVADL